MAHRNIHYGNHIIDLDVNQRGPVFAEPCVFYGSVANFMQPNVNAIIPAPANANYNVQHLSGPQNCAMMYGMVQYNGVQHQHPSTNGDLAVATSSTHYNPYMAPPPATGDFPVPVYHGVHDQLPLLSSHRVDGFPLDSNVRSNYYMDGVRGSFKRTNAEGTSGNVQFSDASAGSSSSVTQSSTSQLEPDGTSRIPDSGPNNMSSLIENGSEGAGRNGSEIIGADSALPHSNNHPIQGYVGQAFQSMGNTWVDPHFASNGADLTTYAWNQAANMPYLQGSVGGSYVEVANMGVPSYQVPVANGSSPGFLHPVIPQGYPVGHQPPFPVQAIRGHNMNFPSLVTASSRRLPVNSTTNTSITPYQGFMDAGPRYFGPVPPAGFRLYRPYRRDVSLPTNTRQHDLPHLRVLPEDGVAMLEIPNYHEVRDSSDQLREMRLDIDNMSYEELLALGEQIGSVGSGLSEEVIMSQLKTRTFASSAVCSTPECSAGLDQETNSCVICQTDYEEGEMIGVLECGHEYHADCLKKWLIVKNSCPICKSAAVNGESKESGSGAANLQQ